MLLSRLRLGNFRNYRDLTLQLPAGLTVVEGANGQGKTNLLEAVYFLSLLRSFRTSRTADLGFFEAAFFRLEAIVQTGSAALSRETLSVVYGERRNLWIDRQPIDTAVGFINRFFCRALIPQDIDLAKGGPALRRRFFNILAAQIDASYLDSLINYTTALRHRNLALRHADKFDAAAIAAYDRLLVKHGVSLTQARHRAVQAINLTLPEKAERLGEQEAAWQIRYGLGISSRFSRLPPEVCRDGERLRDEFEMILRKEQRKDREQGATRHGPHRDDFVFLRRQKPLLSFASEGQMRLFVVALQLAAAAMVAQAAAGKPLVLLIDDVFGELDRRHRGCLLENLAEADQILLACTEMPTELKAAKPLRLTVENGCLL